MLVTNIDITFNYDIEIPWEDQEYHDNLVRYFKNQLETWLDRCNVSSNYPVAINLEYFPGKRKFKIKKFNILEDIIMSRLKEDTKFYKEYFV